MAGGADEDWIRLSCNTHVRLRLAASSPARGIAQFGGKFLLPAADGMGSAARRVPTADKVVPDFRDPVPECVTSVVADTATEVTPLGYAAYSAIFSIRCHVLGMD